ncbi:hypothetical protein ACFQHW_08640 [Lapidilactobacillus achengensis]|uniref:Uncharacterized protein n=1 Tax=Lapidilactobacillus achengensis TaxID=2486000 RepID=A0ABW1UNS6_9LACO|nr:hypothetical protein [Lapidilactobacillus achengensis]
MWWSKQSPFFGGAATSTDADYSRLVQFALAGNLYQFPQQFLAGYRPIQLIHPELALVHQENYSGVTNSKLVTTNHGRQLRGSPSIDHSLPAGVSAQTAVVT